MQKINADTYAYRAYIIERMANGLWDAYKPLGDDFTVRTWESPAHRTRQSATRAISAHIRRHGV